MKPILWITGASGFSGRHLTRHLLDLPSRPELVGLDIAPSPLDGLDHYEATDLLDVRAISRIARKLPPRWVIHLAGAMPPADEPTMWSSNVGITVNLLHALYIAGCRKVRFLCVGSAAEYFPRHDGHALTEQDQCIGLTPYGRTKLAQTVSALHLATVLGQEPVIARTFNLIGPGLPNRLIAGWLVEQFAAIREEITIGNLDSARDFIDIRDAVAAYWLLCQKGRCAEIYNVCSGKGTPIIRLIRLLEEESGYVPALRSDPWRCRATDPMLVYGDPTKIQKETGFEPKVSLQDSIAAMLEFYKQPRGSTVEKR